jgi:hypothetical protein
VGVALTVFIIGGQNVKDNKSEKIMTK